MMATAPRVSSPMRNALTLCGIAAAHIALIAWLYTRGIIVASHRTEPVTVKLIDATPASAVVVRLTPPLLPVSRLPVDPPPEIMMPADQSIIAEASDSGKDDLVSTPVMDGATALLADSPLPAMSEVSYLRPPSPTYPAAARHAHEQGIVVLRVTIDETGRVQGVMVFRSSGHSRLDEAAKQAVSLALFKPYMSAGMPRAAIAMIPIEFSIHG